MNVEDKIVLDKFQLRDYQKPIYDALFNKDYKRLLICLARRGGKDLTLWNAVIRQALMKTCLITYALPTAKLAREAIWDALDIDGNRFLDYVPSRLVESLNVTQMKITFMNGSLIRLIGADSDPNIAFRSTNPYMVVLSEFAYMDRAIEILDAVTPILAANNGILCIASTPNGKNTFWNLMKMAQDNPNWFIYYKNVKDTMHISQEALAEERARMSVEKYEQEYNCSFDRGVEGCIYGRCLTRLQQAGQITSVSWDPALLVHVAIDIGVSDQTSMVFFQVVGDGTIIRIIDCYANTGLGIDHYASILQNKPYRYGKYFAPHDLKVREWGGGAVTRYEKARELGITFTVLEQIELWDGIDNVMANFPKLWIDAEKCRSLIDALENYYKEWDEQRQTHKNKPIHNWASHYADSIRYMCQAIYKTRKGRTAEEFDKARNEALYGYTGKLGKLLADNPKYPNMRG